MAAPRGYSVATLAEHVGHDFGLSEPVVLTQDHIDRFADLTEDRQWIHVDVERARAEGLFGGTVAHGFLTLSTVATAMNRAGVIPTDASSALNYGMDGVRFLSPVRAGSEIVSRFILREVRVKAPGQVVISLEGTISLPGTEKPALVGTFHAMVIV